MEVMIHSLLKIKNQLLKTTDFFIDIIEELNFQKLNCRHYI